MGQTLVSRVVFVGLFGKLTVSMILVLSDAAPEEGGELAWFSVVGVNGVVVNGVNKGDDLKMGDVMGEQSTPIILGNG